MRELRTRTAAYAGGTTKANFQWALSTGRWTRIVQGVVGRGDAIPTKLDKGRATALAVSGIAHGLVAGALHNFDGVEAGEPEVWVDRTASTDRPGVRRKSQLPAETVEIGGVRCTTAADTLLELAGRLDDLVWEQALEYCLRKCHVSTELLRSWMIGNSIAARRVRRVVKLRGGLDVPHTDSLLETLAVQLIRRDPTLPTPTRQWRVFDPGSGRLVARVDLCWPEVGLFLELDGQQHDDQPVYDAVRQNDVTAATGWRCARLTWKQVNRWPKSTLRKLKTLLEPTDGPVRGGRLTGNAHSLRA